MTVKVIITTSGEMFAAAVLEARAQSAEIRRLESTALEAGETIDDRVRRIALCASCLASAFEIFDAIGRAEAEQLSPPDDAPECRGVRGGVTN